MYSSLKSAVLLIFDPFFLLQKLYLKYLFILKALERVVVIVTYHGAEMKVLCPDQTHFHIPVSRFLLYY